MSDHNFEEGAILHRLSFDETLLDRHAAELEFGG